MYRIALHHELHRHHRQRLIALIQVSSAAVAPPEDPGVERRDDAVHRPRQRVQGRRVGDAQARGRAKGVARHERDLVCWLSNVGGLVQTSAVFR